MLKNTKNPMDKKADQRTSVLHGRNKTGTDGTCKDKKTAILRTYHKTTEGQHGEQPDDGTDGGQERKRKT